MLSRTTPWLRTSFHRCRPGNFTAANSCRRHLSSTLIRRSPDAADDLSTTKKPPKLYRYFVDVHGQLFLHDTVPKNFTACFKNTEFLDFFFARVRPNHAPAAPADELVGLDQEWTETLAGKLSELEASKIARAQGYQWISPCMGELNFIQAEDVPIVYKELSAQTDELVWGGTRTALFDPQELFVHPETGRLYTLSPSLGRKGRTPFGEYSLLSSALVLQNFADSLEIEADSGISPGAEAGSVEWKGKRYPLRYLDTSKLHH